jgi:capsular exopolysaccharide synthesis family protein
MSVVHDLKKQPELMDRLAARLARPGGDEMDPGELWAKLWRRKTVIIVVTVLLSAFAAYMVFRATPRYTAEASVLIDAQRNRVTAIEDVLSGLTPDTETVQSEVEVLRSRGLARRTIEKLGLDQDPEFNSSLQPPSFTKKLLSLRSYLPASWFPAKVEEKVDPVLRAEIQKAAVTDAFLGRLSIASQGRSRAIRIAFESEDPAKAAATANTLADFYIVSQLEAKFEATQRANAWLADRIAELRKQVAIAEEAVAQYRAKYGLTEATGGSTITTTQITELSGQLIAARAAAATATSRLRQAEAAAASGNIEAVSEVLASPLIQQLRQQQSDVERQLADLSQQYGERHPSIIKLKNQAAQMEGKIKVEIGKVLQGLRGEVASAQATVGSLQGSLGQLEGKAGQQGQAQVGLDALQRDASAARTLLENFMARAKEIGSQGSYQEADAQVISKAEIPLVASFPKKTILLGISFFGSLFLGVLIAFALEMLDRGFRSTEQIEQAMGVAPLGLIPSLTGLRNIGKTPEDYVIEKPTSAFSESIRSLRTSLMLSDVDHPPKIVLVSSSTPREGKTSTVVALGRLMASVGQRVLIIDCDLRRPRAHKVLGLQSRPGLVDHLAGEATLEEVTQQDPMSPLVLIGAGRPAPSPPDLLGSDQMRRLLKEMGERYDFVLLDSAPVHAVSDTRMLARLADKVVYLVRWADTRREVAINGLRQLRETGASVAGVALTMVDVRKHARYGYSDSGYYHGRTRKYYTG